MISDIFFFSSSVKSFSKTFVDFDFVRRYFLAEIEELEQKSDSETEKVLQMLSGSDLRAFERAFLELHKSKWSSLNGYGKLTSSAFQQYIIAHTFLGIRRPKTGV
ncbi:uncharacterized protein DS421_20g694760 [Arachis hypogaea]|nr:uncharacterized protein DS421_20g694760 [Arachis hypogaea]